MPLTGALGRNDVIDHLLGGRIGDRCSARFDYPPDCPGRQQESGQGRNIEQERAPGRLAGWTAGASLAWPLLVTVGFARARFHGAEFVLIAAPVFLASLLVFNANAGLNKPDYAGMVAQGCAGTTAMYYTALDTAITIAPVWPGKSLVWGGGQDRGMTFKADQMPLFNFQDGDITQFAGERVCLVYIYTPRTLQPERDYVQALLARYPNYTGIIFMVHDELEVQVYQFSVKG